MISPVDEYRKKSIFVLREAKVRFKNPAILWSGGKDSTVILALCREAFFNRIPFTVVYVDNGIDFPETYALKEKLEREWDIKIVTAKSTIKEDAISGISCCGANKTDALKKLVKKEKFDGLVVGIRRDEHGVRAKEREFSPRDENWKWNYKNQPLEIWGHTSIDKNADHYRVHPILHWRESDIWQYIHENNIPTNQLYFAQNGERFRSLGCSRCTIAVKSKASTVPEILEELGNASVSERTGREQDKETQAVMERLRILGYM